MNSNLQYYYRVQQQLGQWLPDERVTRVRNMALLIMGLHLSRAVHLSLIVRKWPIASKDLSLVNRLRRFLDNRRVVVRRWYEPIVKQIIEAFSGQRLRLILDCSKVGFRFRMLTVSIAYKKRALPLAWSIHQGRKGHVGYQKQLDLLKYILSLLPENTEVIVLGDAGFESVHLLNWLKDVNWHFVLRQPGKNQVRWDGQDWIKLADIPIKEGQTRYLGWIHLTQKHDAGPFWLIIHWAKGEDEPWFLIADQPGKRQHIKLYGIRMWTEEMYGDMKGHGFDLETTHLNDQDRISRLILAVSITFVWFIALGSWVVKRGFRHVVDVKSRRDKSYFRIGWDWIERSIRLDKPIPIWFHPYL